MEFVCANMARENETPTIDGSATISRSIASRPFIISRFFVVFFFGFRFRFMNEAESLCEVHARRSPSWYGRVVVDYGRAVVFLLE